MNERLTGRTGNVSFENAFSIPLTTPSIALQLDSEKLEKTVFEHGNNPSFLSINWVSGSKSDRFGIKLGENGPLGLKHKNK